MSSVEKDISLFAQIMFDEMAANEHKGKREVWIKENPRILLAEILFHAGKLAVAIKGTDEGPVKEHAADVANLAMMTLLAWQNWPKDKKEEPAPRQTDPRLRDNEEESRMSDDWDRHSSHES